jgi:hypothetical protein
VLKNISILVKLYHSDYGLWVVFLGGTSVLDDISIIRAKVCKKGIIAVYHEEVPQYALARRVGGPYSLSGHCREDYLVN